MSLARRMEASRTRMRGLRQLLESTQKVTLNDIVRVLYVPVHLDKHFFHNGVCLHFNRNSDTGSKKER